MNKQDTQCSKEQFEQFVNLISSHSTNITLPAKCSYCPYMYNFKCRAEHCIQDD